MKGNLVFFLLAGMKEEFSSNSLFSTEEFESIIQGWVNNYFDPYITNQVRGWEIAFTRGIWSWAKSHTGGNGLIKAEQSAEKKQDEDEFFSELNLLKKRKRENEEKKAKKAKKAKKNSKFIDIVLNDRKKNNWNIEKSAASENELKLPDVVRIEAKCPNLKKNDCLKQFIGDLCIDAIKLSNLQQHSCAITKKQIEKKYLMAVVPYYKIDKLKANNIVSIGAQESIFHKKACIRSVEVISALMSSSVRIKGRESWLPEGMTKKDVINESEKIKKSFLGDKVMSSIYYWINIETEQENVEVMKIDCLGRYKKMIDNNLYKKCNYITGSSYPNCLWIMLIPLRNDSLISLNTIQGILSSKKGLSKKINKLLVEYKKIAESLYELQNQKHNQGEKVDCKKLIKQIVEHYKQVRGYFELKLKEYLTSEEIPVDSYRLYLSTYFMKIYDDKAAWSVGEIERRCEDLEIDELIFEDSDDDMEDLSGA